MKRIFLTFDDGLEAGTDNVLRVLKKHKVRATFFLVGINTHFSSIKYFENVRASIKEFVDSNHLVCNHSFSHCFDFYSAYYKKGLLIGKQRRISPLVDFVFNFFYLKSIERELNVKFLDSSFIKHIIRLPGRNIFNRQHREAINPVFLTQIKRHGYTVVGWHEEWRMSFELSGIRRQMREDLHTEIDTKEKLYPFLDIAENGLLGYDRLIEPYTDVLKRILNNKLNDTILLLHDRAFRDDINNSPAIQLDRLLNELIGAGYIFETIDKYFEGKSNGNN